jgi:hypothetical protein
VDGGARGPHECRRGPDGVAVVVRDKDGGFRVASRLVVVWWPAGKTPGRVGKGNPAARGGRVADVTDARRDVTAGAWLCGAVRRCQFLSQDWAGDAEGKVKSVAWGRCRETRGRTGRIHGGVSWLRMEIVSRSEFVRVRDTTRVARMT